MTDHGQYVEAEGRLRGALARAPSNVFTRDMIAERDQVLARFGPIFSPEHIPELEEAEVKAFLRFENNKHWTGLHRQGNRICADMDLLHRVLADVLDETQPLAQRVNGAVGAVFGLGKAILTAILLVAYPNKYGVWNNTSEAALRDMRVWPEFDRDMTFGQRYERINGLLNDLARAVGVDLWTLDSLLWLALQPVPGAETIAPPDAVEGQGFGLERHLHEFLRDNWERTDLGGDWSLYAKEGDPEAGYEFPCDVGRIDLLARHRQKKEWLVVELKRDQTGDATVGQVLRYMGWVRGKLAQPGESVRGLIIARQVDQGLLYAVSAVPDVDLHLYEVAFHLRPAPGPGGK
jgi:hypothetical protein